MYKQDVHMLDNSTDRLPLRYNHLVTDFQPDSKKLRHWLNELTAFVERQILAMETDPAMGVVGSEGIALAEGLSLPISETPQEEFGALLRHIESAAQLSLRANGPGYMAYVPGGGLVTAAFAECIAGVLNRFTGIEAAAPALVRFESDVLSWLCAEFGLGPNARGIFTSGGSSANLTAMITARHVSFGESGDYRDALVFVSDQVHHSVSKSLRLAGIPSKNLVKIGVDSEFRMDVAALERAVRASTHRRPFLVVVSAGTTNTGSIDPLEEISEICRRYGLWMHVDGAYGGSFVLCARGKELLAGIEQADSITFDPHKGMFLPYGTGCLLVREGHHLAEAHRGDAGYLQDFDALNRAHAVPSPASYGPELSRPYRGLSLWLPLMVHGAGAFRRGLDEKLTLTQEIWTQMGVLPLELMGPPQLTAFAFRLPRQPEESLDKWNARNQRFLKRINAYNRVHLSSTPLSVVDGDAFSIRVCILSFRTHMRHVNWLLEDVERACRED
jgi:aromatic-L-amino-acid/L-tryptophan decarboxylase